jgi:hypothetical protein
MSMHINRVYRYIRKVTYNPLIIKNIIKNRHSSIKPQKYNNIIVRKLSFSSSPPPPPPPPNYILMFIIGGPILIVAKHVNEHVNDYLSSNRRYVTK